MASVVGTAASAQTTCVSTPTTISGTVYTPNGTDPLPNVLVYVPTAGTTLPTLTDGVDTVNGCAAVSTLVPTTLIASTTTDAKGNFTLVNNNLSTGTQLVIQAGKWRRAYTIAPTACAVTSGFKAVMPSTKDQGNIPKIAVLTGSVDSAECVLRKVGVADTEFTNPANGGRINFYQGTASTTSGGARIDSSTPSESALVNSASTLDGYDMLMLPCQGTDADSLVTASATNRSNFVSYANNGGRVFATHFSYVWLEQADTFKSVANGWGNSTISASTTTSYNSDINTTSNTVGQVLSDWMYYIGASTTAGVIPLYDSRQNVTSVNSPTQVWATFDDSRLPAYKGTVMQFTFDTPLGSTSSPTLATTFTNTPTVMQLGSTGNSVAVNVSNSGSGPADTTLTLTFTAASGITISAITPTNGSASGWICNVSTLSCSRTVALASGASDPVAVTLSVASTASVGNTNILTAALTGGNIFNVSQCGRVLFNSYHVEEPASGNTNRNIVFPNECTTGTMTAQEKFLEFSLFNLSNFVAPSNTDSVLIQGTSSITWTPSTTTIYYGHPLDSTILDATSTVAGTFTYSPVLGTIPHVANSPLTVTATFTPTDPNYIGATQTKTITILPDPTASTITQLDQDIHYGEEIGYNNGVDAQLNVLVASPGYNPGNAADSGPFTVYIDSTLVCSGTRGVPLTGPRGNCPDANFLGWNAGTHYMQLNYAGDTDYVASQSQGYPVVVEPDHTTTAATLASPSAAVYQNVNFNAQVANTDIPATIAVGNVTFYDSLNATAAQTTNNPNTTLATSSMYAVGTSAVDATGNASLQLANLTIGTHNISACYGSTINTSGTYNFLNSCSASSVQTITIPSTAQPGTAVTLVSSANPSTYGQSVSFTVQVKTTGSFVAVPTGTVNVLDGSTVLGTLTLDATGSGIYTTASLAVGTHPLTAVYSGSATYTSSKSATLSQVVNTAITPVGAGYQLIVDPLTVPIYVGSTGVVNVQVVTFSNFNSAVKLSCSGLPDQSTCTFADSIIAVGGGTTKLLVGAGAPHNCNSNTPYFSGLPARMGLPILSLSMLTLCVARRRRKLQGIALLALLLAMPTVLTGCGSGNCTDFGLKPGDYNFSITATPVDTQYAPKTQLMLMHVHL
ncbi:Ig-like domain repeat protein [Granulicella cerasi]|uniref:Ig-like domain repeat protein n=1 Tax=Granulicella cerasi TaxID=741063 RepID=A0ABW1ZBH2_9BACT|nr:Ig-like domain-containing protein [Granulicella cerasi]